MLRSVALRFDRLVLVFARVPRDERRAKPLVDGARPRAIETLHEALLGRALAVARAAGVDTRLCTTGDAAAGAGGVEVVRQRGDSFAERLENAVADAFAAGWREVVVIGADTPRLEPRHLERAFSALTAGGGRRAVVGPACDGGYYLLGLNAFAPEAFRGIPLGTPAAGAATLASLGRAGFAVTTLAPLRDVDGAGDLLWLARDRRPSRVQKAARALLLPSPRLAWFASAPPPARAPAAIRSRGPPVPSATLF